MKFDSHLCLVSAQAAPNLTPALDPAFRPASITLAVSTDMQEKARWLESVLKEQGVKVEKLDIQNPYDYFECWDNFAEWLGNQTNEAALNVTGGTKVMAMVAQDVFHEEKKPVFYVNIENDEVIRLDKRGAGFILSSKIKLKHYLEAHGYTVSQLCKPDIKGNIRDLVDRLAYESERLGRALGKLNWLASQAEEDSRTGTFVTPALDRYDQDSKAFDSLISMFKEENMLSLEKNRLVFPDDAARRFVNGGWLEYLFAQSIASIAPAADIVDWGMNIDVCAPNGSTRNELDIACLVKNTLHIIECKSANLAADGRTGDSSGTDAIYKLDALRRMGGLRTKAMLVDFRGSLSESDKKRARQMNLDILSGAQLRDLKGALKTWLK
ncbi:Card1-like endonuclease domain-containing protein [Nitrosomonas halophila]|uniref:DUF1887 domain-containing protein n=1 Tax=Nitrosomonas halophila TaxID=44576 RepID=A0A1H3G6G3_9PROT|nr:DUF1887 family CARF protein [Nitrosomonas halophila]SDX98851.1 protein of unknown function [Nitrosomonas halophila]